MIKERQPNAVRKITFLHSTFSLFFLKGQVTNSGEDSRIFPINYTTFFICCAFSTPLLKFQEERGSSVWGELGGKVEQGREVSRKLKRIFSYILSKSKESLPAKFPVLFMRAAGGHLTGMLLWLRFNYRKARSQEARAGEGLVPLLVGDSHMTSFCIQQ